MRAVWGLEAITKQLPHAVLGFTSEVKGAGRRVLAPEVSTCEALLSRLGEVVLVVYYALSRRESRQQQWHLLPIEASSEGDMRDEVGIRKDAARSKIPGYALVGVSWR